MSQSDLPQPDQPLSGIVVLELAGVLAGPSAGQYLAELGATVIKIENPRNGGDVTRSWRIEGEQVTDGRSAYFSCCNWGKQSVAIDITAPDGLAVVEHLAKKSDVVLSSYRPGSAERLHVDHDALLRLNDRLVCVSVTGYGADDPRSGYDAAIQAESGFMSMNGQPDGPPTKMPVALVDVLAAHHIKEEVLLGLLIRSTTGKGRSAYVSLFDAALASLANQGAGWLQSAVEPRRMGSAHPSIAPYGTPYLTADGHWIVLAVGTDKQFERLTSVLSLTHEAAAKGLGRNEARVEKRAELEALLRPAVNKLSADDLENRLQQEAIPFSRIASVPQALATRQAQRLVLGEAGGPRGIRTAIGQVKRPLSPPPRFGEHSAVVLRTVLGMTDQDVAKLVAAKVLLDAGAEL